MKVRKAAAGRFLAILGASATVALVGTACEPRNADINRVQPGYVRKAIFQTNDEWYYRRTIAKSETTNEYVIEGHGDIQLDRVKFEIQEDVLLAYKPYEAIAGSGYAERPGNSFYKGTILAAWPITSHFDVIRTYDPLTGNQGNEIVENAVDRVWHERDYMRVDWSRNLIDGSISADYAGYWFPVSYVSTGNRWSNLETQPTDPFASRFSDDYIEVTTHSLLGMDILMCAAFTGYSMAGYGNCGYGEAKLRHSFLRVKEKSDYVPVAYPDSVVRKDANGNPIYDPDTGEVVREPIYTRFGVFRVETPTFDRGYGHTESGRIFRAMLFNLWQRSTDEQGNVIPMRDREPKPIVYYLNSDYPARYRRAAQEVAADYNRIYSQMIADLKGISVDEVQQLTESADGKHRGMFQIRDNDCNEENILAFVSSNPDYLYAVERAVCGEGSACSVMNAEDVRRLVGVGNLDNVCTSLEAATLDPSTGKARFEWQRVGDSRYNMVVWLNNPQQSPWGGYGPMHADAKTGETVAATSFLRGWSYEVAASNVVDFIEFINDEKSVSEIVYGQDIRKHMTESLRRRQAMATGRAGAGLMAKLDRRIESLGDKSVALRKIDDPQHLQHRLEKAKGSRLEDALITDMDLAMAAERTWKPNSEGAAPSAEIRERASPLGRMTKQNPTSALQRRAKAALGRAGFCFLQHDFDPHWAGMALALKDIPDRASRYDIVVNRLVKHVMLHELGHNVGLAHNFEGSYDALNYDDRFWNLHWGTDEEKLAGAYDEFRHTTVMEYLSSKGAFADFLGKYDEAAIRFAYANQVQVFNSDNVDPGVQGGEAMRNWRYYNDYTKIPGHLCGGAGCASEDAARDALKNRTWVSFDPQNPPSNEVPYLFCDNFYERMTPFCATFDYGSNLREIFANYYSMWSDYYFFNNFLRDRLSPLAWSPTRALMPVYYTYQYMALVTQYFYYLDLVDPAFDGSDLKTDMATTLANGLNMATEILATPQPERMCPWRPAANQPPVYIPWYFFPDTCDQYADINSPVAQEAEMIELPLGDARPTAIGFTPDYEDWEWEFVGSYFDKSNVLMLLGWTEPTLFRFNYDLDVRNYFVSLYRLFEDELLQFFDRVTNLDTLFVTLDTATSLGSYWCESTEAPGVKHLGRFEPKRMIDLGDGAALPGPTGQCTNPALVYPALLSNMPYQAMFIAHAMFSSDFDFEVNMGKNMKVFVRGADDDFVDWSSLPNCETATGGASCYCATTDSLTGLEYRSIQLEGQPSSVGCRLIERTIQAESNYLQSRGDPFNFDNWRQWIERLEYARDLYRLYNTR